MLLHEFALDEQAVADLRKAIETQRSILREVDSGNEQARREMEKAEQLLASWQTG
jgi:hypothetical protein